MILKDLGELRQLAGYSMHMMAEYLHISLEDYAELEFEVREPNEEEGKILERLLYRSK